MCGVTIPAHAAEDFLQPEQAFQLEVAKPGDGKLHLTWSIAPGYYLYRDRMAVTASPSGGSVEIGLPPGIVKDDPNFGMMEVYHDEVTMKVAPAGAGSLDVTWQGCADAGLCYPPQTQTIQVDGVSAATGTAASADASAQSQAPGAASFWNSVSGSDTQITQWLGERPLAWTLPLFFLLGIALAFTPCVLPMLPIVSGIVVGSQAPPRRAFALSMAFVLPMALTYSALGVAAALAGANLQAMLQNRWTMLALGGIYVVLALGMFGVFTLQLPARLRDKLEGASRGLRGGSLPGAAAMGVLSALLVGPCMTAPLAGALLYIAQSGNVVQGALLLAALGLGMGTPLVIVGTLGSRFLPKPGPWMDRVKVALGFLLLGTAVWMLERVVPAHGALLMWGTLLLAVAVTLVHAASRGAAAVSATGAPNLLAIRTLAVVAGLWGSAMVLGAAGGGADPWRPLKFAAASSTGLSQTTASLEFEPIASEPELQARLAAAREAGQPVLVDFYADWCVSCKAIEKEVFGDTRVHRALAGAVLLRADVTTNDVHHRELMRTHQVIGPPTVMMFDATGRERRDARLVGEFTVEQFLHRQPGPSNLDTKAPA
ncbi:MAG: thiol:disulfide interchange protein [Betaproteobacteria bacterium HGW-Betaproteobacteria-16]|nr:MAG: thiol:disulfide interchange protein [Betaproteobacteria bacterium HGW-Betaproteobacteria-16]